MLQWNVYYGNFNAKQIEVHNIFNHYGFVEDCKKYAKKYNGKKDPEGDFEKFSESVRRSLMYYYWSKCEWEIILSGWPQSDRFREEKVDVYDQVMLNWDVFIRYLWENRSELKKL